MDPLIDAEALRDRLRGSDPPRLLDVRWRLGGSSGIDDYRSGHLPGAVYVDLERELSGPPGAGGRHPLPDGAVLQTAMRRWGLDDGTPVVVYDADTSLAAARAWWLLRWAGHGDVRVLDGGLAAWVASGGAVATDLPAVAAGTATVRAGSIPALDAESAARTAAEGVLVDVRAPERFSGQVEPVDPIGGHIPGAVNVPVGASLAADGRFRTAGELRAHFDRALGRDRRMVGIYCGSGIAAAQQAIALERVGIEAVVYAGSWSDWITDDRRPVAAGDG